MSDRRDAPDDQRAPPPQPTSERETDDELTGILKATQLNFVLPKILGFLEMQSDDVTNLKRSSSILKGRIEEDLSQVNWGRGGELFKVHPKDLEKWIDQYTRLDSRGQRVGATALRIYCREGLLHEVDNFKFIKRHLPTLTQLKYLSLGGNHHSYDNLSRKEGLELFNIISRLRLLKTLDISENFEEDYTEDDIDYNDKNFLFSTALATCIASLPYLEHLNLKFCEILRPRLDVVMNALGAKKHPDALLKSLNLKYVTHNATIRRDLLAPLELSGFRNLRRLDVTNLQGISSRRLFLTLASFCPRLTVLTLSSCNFEGDRSDIILNRVHNLAELARKREELEKDNRSGVFDEFEKISASEAFFQLCSRTNLRSLSLFACDLSEELLESLIDRNVFRNLTELKDFYLFDSTSLNCDRSVRLLRTCSRLRVLQYGFFDYADFTDNELYILFESLPASLEVLDLRGLSQNITHKGLQHLLANLPRLKNLRQITLNHFSLWLPDTVLDFDKLEDLREYIFDTYYEKNSLENAITRARIRNEIKLYMQELEKIRDYLIENHISYKINRIEDEEWRFIEKDDDNALQGGGEKRKRSKKRGKKSITKRKSVQRNSRKSLKKSRSKRRKGAKKLNT